MKLSLILQKVGRHGLADVGGARADTAKHSGPDPTQSALGTSASLARSRHVHVTPGCLPCVCVAADYTAFADAIPEWEKHGVHTVQVYSGSNQGYVHDVFEREGLARLPADAASSVGAVLCGHKAMCQAVTSLLTGKGVPPEKIVLNF